MNDTSPANHALIDKYRDPKSGNFSFPDDVAKIIRHFEALLEAANQRHAATLEAVERARDDAWAEFSAAADKIGNHCISCGHVCGDPEKDLAILRKAGARSCCPEREIEPLSQAILALRTQAPEPARVTVQEAAAVFLQEIRRIKFARLDAEKPIDRYFMNMPETDLLAIKEARP